MEIITSRKNKTVAHLRRLGREREYRDEQHEFLCDGIKLLREAIAWNAEITCVAYCGDFPFQVPCRTIIEIPQELLDYISPMKNPSKVIFSVKMLDSVSIQPNTAIVLDTIQDPGNLGTILRTANAFQIDIVLLCGQCADIYNPKTVRASMGAVFRQPVLSIPVNKLKEYLSSFNLRLFGTALSDSAVDIRGVDLTGAALAIGSEGKGLSDALLSLCDKQIIIPMSEQCESLNAAVAAAIIMWELNKTQI